MPHINFYNFLLGSTYKNFTQITITQHTTISYNPISKYSIVDTIYKTYNILKFVDQVKLDLAKKSFRAKYNIPRTLQSSFKLYNIMYNTRSTNLKYRIQLC